ncbi:MAG: HD domain-containing protein [Calditrichia bacterium]
MNKDRETDFFEKIYQEVTRRSESGLCRFATRSAQAVRRIPETAGPRAPFALDRDRVLYSGAFRRYSGKTQVIYFASQLDEMLSSRSIHTLSVAQISRTIGKFLGLNQELIEAIALAHDLGHSPFGHDGELFLSDICREHKIGEYHHHLQSLHIVDRVAKHGKGLNLTFQVRDGIISHDGEVHNQVLKPDSGKTEKDLMDYVKRRKEGEYPEIMPATLEGCVVRITDTIAYIGQDIEDAIRIGLIKRSDIPEELREQLGSTNGEIIDTLVRDVVQNSYDKPFVSFSEAISEKLLKLKKFNYEKIYHSPRLKKDHEKIKLGFRLLFDLFLQDLQQEKDTKIFRHFLEPKDDEYLESTNDAEKVRDYIGGMTDRYFVETLKERLVPEMNLQDLQ